MSVIEAKIQTVEDMYRLIWTAVANKQPISAIYKERYRLFCPHRLGRNRLGQPRVLCYQYGGERKRFGASGITGKLTLRDFRETASGGVIGWFVEDCAEPFPARYYSRPATCVVDADIDAEDQPD